MTSKIGPPLQERLAMWLTPAVGSFTWCVLTTSSGKSIVDWLSLLVQSQCECNSTFEVLAFPRTKESILYSSCCFENKSPIPYFQGGECNYSRAYEGLSHLVLSSIGPWNFCSLASTAKPACEHLKPNRCKNNNYKSNMCKRERGNLLELLLLLLKKREYCQNSVLLN